jgi:hypothetical protein
MDSPAKQTAVQKALKEWAAVAAAMRAGRQSLLLRAGGIADPAGRFGFDAPRFWIYPTRFHEAAERLVPDARPFIEAASDEAEPPATPGGHAVRRIDLMAVVDTVRWVADRAAAERLAPMHVLAPTVVRERFDYREPGLAAALVRVWRRREPHRIVETSEMEGCRSWVTLPEPLACDALEPVLDDAAFEAVRTRFLEAIEG